MQIFEIRIMIAMKIIHDIFSDLSEEQANRSMSIIMDNLPPKAKTALDSIQQSLLQKGMMDAIEASKKESEQEATEAVAPPSVDAVLLL